MTTPPRSLIQTWEDAFQYPIPQIYQLERQLRAELMMNKEKLRGLVGESYRDLLKTAERLIEMEKAAHRAEDNFGQASRICNSRLLERKALCLKGFQERASTYDRVKYAFAARMAILESCPAVLSRLLRKDVGDSCLIAGKIFVISRLLWRSFDQIITPRLARIKDQHANFRPILLQHVDALLSTVALPKSILISTLTTFSILNTSSSAEVLRHFLKVRSTALSLHLSQDPTLHVDFLKSIALYNKTLEDTHTIFPQTIRDALLLLTSKNLLDEIDVLAIPELQLDINGVWLPNIIRGFIPWVQHDDLGTSKCKEMVRKWAEDEMHKLTTSLEIVLTTTDDLGEITKLRTKVLGLWRPSWKIARIYLTNGNAFREVFIQKIGSTVTTQVDLLDDVGKMMENLLNNMDKKYSDPSSLWSLSPLPIHLSNGGAIFKKAVSTQVHGKNNAVRHFLTVYNSWSEKIDCNANIIRNLRVASAQATDDDEDFDIEEEQIHEDLEDSEIVEKELIGTIDDAYRNLENRLVAIVDTLRIEDPCNVLSVQQQTFLLRSIRQLRQLPAKRNDDVLISLNWFGLGIVPKLHLGIAREVSKTPLEAFTRLLQNRNWESQVVSKPLWEGTPSLPVQPSPLIFRFLHELVAEMSIAGEDLWTPSAVNCVKTVACDNAWKTLAAIFETREYIDKETLSASKLIMPKSTLIPSSSRRSSNQNVSQSNASYYNLNEQELKILLNEPNDDIDSATKSNITDVIKLRITKEWTIQLLFDCLFLDEALHRRRKRGASGSSSIFSLAAKVDSVIAAKLHLDEDIRMRLESSSSEYWKKTCLLFALLDRN